MCKKIKKGRPQKTEMDSDLEEYYDHMGSKSFQAEISLLPKIFQKNINKKQIHHIRKIFYIPEQTKEISQKIIQGINKWEFTSIKSKAQLFNTFSSKNNLVYILNYLIENYKSKTNPFCQSWQLLLAALLSLKQIYNYVSDRKMLSSLFLELIKKWFELLIRLINIVNNKIQHNQQYQYVELIANNTIQLFQNQKQKEQIIHFVQFICWSYYSIKKHKQLIII